MIAGYIRVSTEDQDYQSQKSDIEEEYDIDQWYADIEHGDVFSGRGGLQDLLEEAEQYDRVVFPEISRAGRTAPETRDIVRDLRSDGCTVTFQSSNIELEPRDEMKIGDVGDDVAYQVMVEFAEQELRRIRNRTKRGVRQAMSEGKHVGQPPRGYEVWKGFLKPDEPEYSAISQFIREVNKGRAKAPTARFFGIDETSYGSILSNSDKYWDAEYVGNEEWRRRRTEVQNGEKELEELGE